MPMPQNTSDTILTTMELLSDNEINLVAKRLGLTKTPKWRLEERKELIGYLGDYLTLIIETDKDGKESEIQMFVKCMPRFDKWKSEFIQESRFFYKEYVMMSRLFEHFENGEGTNKWRPESLFLREDLFIFEDVSKIGYKMPSYKETMKFDILKATVKTVARFHAQSYIYEEKRSKELGKPYRIWDDFSEYLQEPVLSKIWRDTGSNGVIDCLKLFSKYKSNPGFNEKVETVIPMLFEKTMDLMKPNKKYRNVVVHRDLWSNNIFVKDDEISEPHALFVDFQTVLYASPMLDLSSVIYFNSLKAFRDTYTSKLIDIYYDTLSNILKEANVNINTVFRKDVLADAYEESLLFAITQASLIVPYTCIGSKWKEQYFSDPVRSEKINLVSRSEEYIEVANEDPVYKDRVTELFDEIVERYVYSNTNKK